MHDYLASLIAWTKIIPQFESLKRDDQVYLVQSAWNEITIADIAHKSIDYEVCKIFIKALLIFELFLKAYNFFYQIGINFEALLIIIFTKFDDGGDKPRVLNVTYPILMTCCNL